MLNTCLLFTNSTKNKPINCKNPTIIKHIFSQLFWHYYKQGAIKDKSKLHNIQKFSGLSHMLLKMCYSLVTFWLLSDVDLL